MNRQIELTTSEIELLNQILLDFQGREGIGLEHALGIIHYKINGEVGGFEKINTFIDKRFRCYNMMFKRPSPLLLNYYKNLIMEIKVDFMKNLHGEKEMKKTYLVRHPNKDEYCVFITRGNDVDLCVLPYTSYTDASAILLAYTKIGYRPMGVKSE